MFNHLFHKLILTFLVPQVFCILRKKEIIRSVVHSLWTPVVRQAIKNT
jgi:hypothetical protein